MRARTGTFLFFLVALVLCSYHLDTGHNDNTMARAASVASLVDRGTLEITAIHGVTNDKCLVNGRYYSDKAPLPTFIVLPFHWAAVELGLVNAGENGTLTDGLLRLGGFLCGSVPLAVLITLAWRSLRARDEALPMNAALLASIPLLGSFLFVYTGSFYNHLPGALFSVLAARSASQHRYLFTGFWGGAAFLCESVLLLFVALWTVQQFLTHGWRNALHIGLGLLPALLGAAAHNVAVTGEVLTFPNAYAVNYEAMHEQYGFFTWQPKAFFNLLISDHRGLLFYMPFLLMALWTLPRTMRAHDLLRDPFVLPALVLIALFLTHATWWGGWTYGPRYLMASATLLAFATMRRIGARRLERWAVPALCGIGLVCALGALFTVSYSMPSEELHPLITEVWPRVARLEFNGMQWPVLLGASPAAAAMLYLPTLALGLLSLVRIERSSHAPVPLH
ncbi:MAG: hypothetical protein R2815_05335 [Flavobacteriales bacterium]